jgi:RimJ/RimL family protein N-acetyltransferase
VPDQERYKIRIATPTDRDGVISNVNKVIAEGSLLAVQKFTMTDNWRACLACGLDVQNRRALAVAAIEGKIVGHCRLFPTWGGCCTAHVADVGFLVARKHRNIGVGSSLLAYILDLANELSYEKVTLSTACKNTPTLRLAEKFGFVEEGRRLKQYYMKDQYIDEVLMAHFVEV